MAILLAWIDHFQDSRIASLWIISGLKIVRDDNFDDQIIHFLHNPMTRQ